VPAFYLDTHEVTEFSFRGNLDPHRSRQPARGPEYPETFVSYDDATACAERLGKRLPNEAEYEFAATAGGTQEFPWGNDFRVVKSWPFGQRKEPDFDHTNTTPPVYGLYSNVAEWTASKHTPYPGTPPDRVARFYSSPMLRQAFENSYIVRGGPFSVVKGTPDVSNGSSEWTPRHRFSLKRDNASHPGLGFRCARSAAPSY